MSITDLIPWKRCRNIPVRRMDYEPSERSFLGGMDRIFDRFFEPFSDRLEWRSWDLSGFTPMIDVVEKDDDIVVMAEIPGITEEDIHLELTDEALIIRGEKRTETEEKRKDYYFMERTHGSFHRSVPLPTEVDRDKVTASLRNGVLTVKLPKSEQARRATRRIPVSVS